MLRNFNLPTKDTKTTKFLLFLFTRFVGNMLLPDLMLRNFKLATKSPRMGTEQHELVS